MEERVVFGEFSPSFLSEFFNGFISLLLAEKKEFL